MDKTKNAKILLTFMTLMALTSFLFITCIWILATSRTAEGFTQTFSYMLATDPVLMSQYEGWLPIQTIVTLLFIYKTCSDLKDVIAAEELPDPNNEEVVHCCGTMSNEMRHSISTWTTAFYSAFGITSIFGFILIACFPTTSMSFAHNIYAAYTFLSVFLMQASLFVKRLVLCVHKTGRCEWYTVLILNGMLVIAIFVLLILFAVFITGQLEFAMTMCMCACWGFQIYDFSHQIRCPYTRAAHEAPVVTITLDLKRYLLQATGAEKNKLLSYGKED